MVVDSKKRKDSANMVRIENFETVVKSSAGDSKENALHVWKNDEVDTSRLVQIIASGEWSELEQVEGFYATVYEKAGEVYLFCDRLGIYPLFYYIDNGIVYASPKLSEIVKRVGLTPKYCIEGVISMLLFGHHIADETVFEGIKRCKRGETIVINRANASEKTIIWRKEHTYRKGPSIEVEVLAEVFVRSVEKNISGASRVILALSGGFDSRAVLGAALECVGSERIHTLTFGGKDSYDLRVAQFIAKKTGVRNTPFIIADQVFDDDFLRKRARDYSYGYSAFATQPPEMISYLSKDDSENRISLWGAGGDAITGSHLRTADISLQKCNSLKDYSRLLIKKRSFLALEVVSEITGLCENEIITIVSGLIERSVVRQYDKPWQFLDAWDIFVRGRKEIISVLPYYVQSWRCPHLSRSYFNEMSTQCYEEKFGQNLYKRMLSSRFKFLYSLPSRRLKGKSLVWGPWQLYWVPCWRIGKLKQALNRIITSQVDSIERNYGKNKRFFRNTEGKNRLQKAINILLQEGILTEKSNSLFEISLRNTQAGLTLVTLGYAFDNKPTTNRLVNKSKSP